MNYQGHIFILQTSKLCDGSCRNALVDSGVNITYMVAYALSRFRPVYSDSTLLFRSKVSISEIGEVFVVDLELRL